MFSETVFKFIVYTALGWTGLGFLTLVGLFLVDWLKKKIW
jgi:hypothetical protein